MEKQKKIRKRLLTAFFIVFNVGVIAWTAWKEYHSGSSAAKLSSIGIRWQFLLPAIGCCIGAILVESFKYGLIMKQVGQKMNLVLACKTVLIGRYYDNITPSGIGGQPMQIYYLKKNGTPSGESAAITVAGFISVQFAFIILALFTVICLGGRVQADIVRALSYFGIICYSIFPVSILFFTFLPAFAKTVTRGIVSLLSGLRLVKNKEKTFEHYIENVESYSESLKGLIGQKSMCVVTVVFGLIYQIAVCSIPYFVILAFGGKVAYISCFATTVMIYAAITFIPTPGNSGVAEGVFYAVFSMLTTGAIFWAMLVWRFLVYYIFIAVGIGIHLWELFKKKKGQSPENQEAESRV